MSRIPEPPHPRLTKPVKWRPVDDEVVEAWNEKQARWVRQRAWSGDVLEGLAAGEPFQSLVDRVAKRHPTKLTRKQAERTVRNYLYNLHRMGHVTMDFGEPPTRFADRYEVVRELGRGGVGVAWLCRDEAEDRIVVVKHAWGYFADLAITDEQMRREAVTMQNLEHPGIVPYFDSFEKDGLLHLVRGFVEGEEMTGTARPLPEARRLALDVADILVHIHEKGYLLLDPRPANFLLVSGRPVLVDVGLCTPFIEDELRFRAPVGSPGFTSPEMVKDRVATVRSDVFGFGRLLFHLVSGTLPKKGWTSPDYAERLPDAATRDLVLRISAEDPADRPATMRDVRALLEAWPVQSA